jgi:mono/diheme cytochrome c family protein
MLKSVWGFFLLVFFFAFLLMQFNCSEQKDNTASKETKIERGAYLVNLGGCNDCHSPKIFTPNGPIPDTTRLLSGAHMALTSLDFDPKIVAQGKWTVSNSDFTAWVGAWGISYTANLTPYKETGLGSWTEDRFIRALRTGKHLGEGRPILPPMPWPLIGKLKDDDLKDIFAYLHSLPPINNKVPDPQSPDELAKLKMGKK